VAVRYEVVTSSRSGTERKHPYTSDSELQQGSVIRLHGRDWLIDRVEDGRAYGKPARYRLRLHHPDGREEVGAFRRYRPDAPRLGHTFTTLEDRQPISWQVIDVRLEHDDDGEPYIDLLAERDYGEVEELPDHELEHALLRGEDLPDAVAAVFARAERENLSLELVALEPGEAPDWDEAKEYIDALILEEIEDDLLEQCGVNPDSDPRDTWLDTVKERLLSDLAAFRDDVEGDHDEIEEWDFRDGRIFASVGSEEDESNPNVGHGWMTRLVDVSALSAAGFSRVRKAELEPI
jgi:hypothetical protein